MNRSLPVCRRSGWFTILLLILGAYTASAQTMAAYGDWQLYVPNNRARVVTDAGDRVYVAAEDAFFYYDKSLNTTRMLTRRDGLSDVGVSTVAYDSVSQQTLIAYKSGNIDVLGADGSIRNVTDVLRKQISGNKTINSIYFSGKSAYLSCDFGLLLFDMTKLEVRESYGNIGPSGSSVRVYATTVANGRLFAATSIGIMHGLLTDNLLDYTRWTINQLGGKGSGDFYKTLATQNNQVYAGVNQSVLFVYKGSSAGWQEVPDTYTNDFRRLRPTRTGLLIASDAGVGLLSNAGRYTLLPKSQTPDPRDVLRAKGGMLFVADYKNGLLLTTDGGQNFESFATNAPANVTAFGLLADRATNTVDIFTGGFKSSYEQSGNKQGFYEYRDGKWTNYTKENFPDLGQFPNPKDMTHGVRTPDGTLYVASYGDGLLEWKGPGEFKVYNPTNSPLRAPEKDVKGDINYTRVTDLTTDADGNVWVVNRHEILGRSGVHVFTPSASTWRSLPYFLGSDNLDRIVLDDYKGVWASAARKGGTGVVAYDEATQITQAYNASNGGLPSNNVYAIVKDRKGAIWAGLESNLNGGVAVFTDPSQAFVPGSTTGFQVPIVRRGETVGFPALRGETVLCIAVDGGNRKWFGTERGLWLFTEDADEALLHFTTDNSPLPSNRIIDVAVNDKTGDVFVLTDAGLASYRGSATITEGKPSCANVFPNPVRTNFTGEVGISGLANNALVKITDITGALVYQTRANGGTITWNLADYKGRKVQSGVYLVLSSDADGNQGCISKIAVVQQ
ncbi:type IX secretion system anionic LPS delivery protein PorZ [Hymenobacter cavernae]|uniref:ABC transporter substrate-binding protein n=1 Tax=Hymenobacter cavernae TaxID=2044852 RepID=A0ABQ1UII7_9BACT|nr:T9SS type A sorting domain-containing protein [Hymenobacter cavernae]GGF17656.1 ABC transporter substrate-binding protein [Hymenobacter cavernae]